MKVVVNNEMVIVHENARVIDAVHKYIAENNKLKPCSIMSIEDNFEHPISSYGRLSNGDIIQIKFK